MLPEEAENEEDKEADPDALEHTDDRQTGEQKEKTEAGKVNADQMEEEQFEEGPEAKSIEGLAHTIVPDTGVVPNVDQARLPAQRRHILGR